MEIDTKKFYSLGMVCFLVIGVAHAVSLILNFNSLNFFDITASIFSTIFDFVVFGFFKYLYDGLLKVEQSSEEEIKNYFG